MGKYRRIFKTYERRPVIAPVPVNLSGGDIMLRSLTESEKKKPFAKYFHRPMTPPPKEAGDALAKGPIDPSLALPIQDKDKLLDSGYLPCERGYCVMPDGTGFVAGLTKMPGVTMEMLDWWFVCVLPVSVRRSPA